MQSVNGSCGSLAELSCPFNNFHGSQVPGSQIPELAHLMPQVECIFCKYGNILQSNLDFSQANNGKYRLWIYP